MHMEQNVRKLTRKDALLIYEWCKKEYGPSKYRRKYPSLKYRSSKSLPIQITGPEKEAGLFVFGVYIPDVEDHSIYINNSVHSSLKQLAHTIIHEYQHFKQNMYYYYKIIGKYKHDMASHPYEISADKIADRDSEKCVNELFSSIY